MKSILLTVALLSVIVGVAYGLDCYVCTSLDKKCLDDPTSFTPQKCTNSSTNLVPHCLKMYSKIGDLEGADRSCTYLQAKEDKCDKLIDTDQIKSTSCVCNEDKCNGAGRIEFTILPILSIIGLLFVKY